MSRPIYSGNQPVKFSDLTDLSENIGVARVVEESYYDNDGYFPFNCTSKEVRRRSGVSIYTQHGTSWLIDPVGQYTDDFQYNFGGAVQAVNSIYIGSGSSSVVKSGTRYFIAEFSGGNIIVIDVTSPFSPVIVFSAVASAGACSLGLYSSKLCLVYTSNNSTFTMVNALDTEGATWSSPSVIVLTLVATTKVKVGIDYLVSIELGGSGNTVYRYTITGVGTIAAPTVVATDASGTQPIIGTSSTAISYATGSGSSVRVSPSWTVVDTSTTSYILLWTDGTYDYYNKNKDIYKGNFGGSFSLLETIPTNGTTVIIAGFDDCVVYSQSSANETYFKHLGVTATGGIVSVTADTTQLYTGYKTANGCSLFKFGANLGSGGNLTSDLTKRYVLTF